MKTKIGVFNLILIGSSVLVAAMNSAQAGMGVDLLGAATYSMASGSPTPTSKFGLGYGGLMLNFRLGSKVDLQLGGLYLQRAYNNGRDRNMSYIDSQMGFKIKLGQVIGLHFGGYGDFIMSSTQTTSNPDYGAYGGLSLRIPLGKSVGFLIYPQYHYALSTLTVSNGTLSPHEVLMMVGFSFGGMSSSR